MNTQRDILHFDMDAFFAAVEQLDRPALRGWPVLVGGDPQGRGVVSTASYEARPYGCRSAMPMAEALRRCPDAIIIKPRMRRYIEVSDQIFEIVGRFTPIVEPLSIDEAFLDVTGSTRLFGASKHIAAEMKRSIRDETGLTASVGVAPNKFLAKLASDLQKPDGLVVVPADNVQVLLDPLPISRLWGVGKMTLPKIEALGVKTFGDLRRFSEDELRSRFGESGEHFHQLVHGIDDREVVPDREAKSISHEVTFPVDVTDREHLRDVLLDQTDHVALRLRRQDRLARTVTLKMRTPDSATITRSITLDAATDQTEMFWAAASGLFETWSQGSRASVRLIGMGVSHFSTREGQQLSLFDNAATTRRSELDRTMDAIRDRYGDDAVVRGGARPAGS